VPFSILVLIQYYTSWVGYSRVRVSAINRRINSVEHSAIWDSVVTFADSVSSTTEDVSQKSFPDVLLWWLRLRGPRNNICYSGHVKYIFWLIDWLDRRSCYINFSFVSARSLANFATTRSPILLHQLLLVQDRWSCASNILFLSARSPILSYNYRLVYRFVYM